MTGEGEGGAKVFKLRMNGRKKITVSKTWNVKGEDYDRRPRRMERS